MKTKKKPSKRKPRKPRSKTAKGSSRIVFRAKLKAKKIVNKARKTAKKIEKANNLRISKSISKTKAVKFDPSNMPIELSDVDILKNRYAEFTSGHRRTCLEYAMTLASNKIFAEFGVYKGGSAKILLNGCEKLYLYDSFEGLPCDWNEQFKKGHFKCDIPSFNDPRVIISQGLFEDVIDKFNNIEFGLVNIDCDLYESTKTVLYNLKTFYGQIIVFDEFFNIDKSLENEYKAFKEWVEEKKVNYDILARTEYSQAIVKIL